MRFYRFELAFDGEPQGVGFLQGAEDVGLDNKDLLSLLDPFEKLPSPYLDEPLGAMFFFTEEGMDRYWVTFCMRMTILRASTTTTIRRHGRGNISVLLGRGIP